MGHELICNWLGLQPDEWPPDHYRLLGLTPGEGDPALIEQRVHQRLDTVRCYQMLHPEQATEAMNRLAQAFVCLTESNTKRLYDASLLGAAAAEMASSPAAATATAEASPDDGAMESRDSLDFLTAPALAESAGRLVPPPLPSVTDTEEIIQGPATVAVHQPAMVAPPPLPVLPTAPPAPSEPIDPVVEAAQSSRHARRGLGTKRALYQRLAQTRQLIRAWNKIGVFLASPKRRPFRRAEVAELLDGIATVRELLARFPPLLGEAGQPGYMVLELDQIEPTHLQKISARERETLGNDWRAGHKLLTSHRAFLREEVRQLRQRPFRDRLARALHAYVTDQPAVVLLLLALLALNIALWRTHFWYH
jgi:hypothetical protein